MNMADFRAFVLTSLRYPQEAARMLMALNLPMSVRWLAVGAVVTLSAALGTAAEIVFAAARGTEAGPNVAPMAMAALQFGLVLYGAWAMSFFGRMMGGRGTFPDALILVAWIEALLLIGQTLQIFVMLLIPILSFVGSMALIVLLFWLLIHFTAALNGFTNMVKVGVAVILIFIGSGMLAGTLLVSLGFVPVPQNM
ncbi:YIP1 family protein [Sinirhodobacter populi]|uniref:YIP1 family protein n=1 Tax=Paenirhodobacter populi TaxID=2306993 RepID=A0A443K1T2_9RHOB|nr:YIP1 family protein [Sinirhodobacter populi]RWR26720.1 YIP1 family protein [Sinirhodobacter populi]